MDSENLNQTNRKKSFWNTTIGIITKITAFLTAITALIIAFRNFSNTVHPQHESSSSSSTPSYNDTENIVREDSVHAIPPPPVEKKPDISISAFSINPSEITLDEDAKPKLFTAMLEAFNNGNALAENCSFTLTSDVGELGNASSESFSLDPNTKKQVVINATISNSGNITAKLVCSNDTEKSSEPVHVTVYNYGTVHHVIPKTQ